MIQDKNDRSDNEFDLFDQKNIVESLIFASNEPLRDDVIARCAGISQATLEKVVAELNEEYLATRRSFRIERVNGGYRFYSLPEYHSYIKRAGEIDRKLHLSQAALEALAIIAYKQPITRAEIERIRGVDCDGVLRNLMARDLICIDGRSNGPGRPHLFVTTEYFLEFFGLPSLSHLPPLPPTEEVPAKLPSLKLARKGEVMGDGVGDDQAETALESAAKDSSVSSGGFSPLSITEIERES